MRDWLPTRRLRPLVLRRAASSSAHFQHQQRLRTSAGAGAGAVRFAVAAGAVAAASWMATEPSVGECFFGRGSSSRDTGARRMESDYKLGREIGRGAFGVVYAGTCRRTGREVAIKVIRRTNPKQDEVCAARRTMPITRRTSVWSCVRAFAQVVRREVDILRRVALHRGTAELIDSYEDDESFYLVMEFVTGGELFDALIDGGAFSEARAADMVRQIADALAFLHAQGLAHLDIKPENVLLTSKDVEHARIKLVDFGISRGEGELTDVKPGTWAYWPPEAFEKPRQVGVYTDMWALGCVLFILLSGYHPFDPQGDADLAEMQRRISTEVMASAKPETQRSPL